VAADDGEAKKLAADAVAKARIEAGKGGGGAGSGGGSTAPS